jgi:hypothetical protein
LLQVSETFVPLPVKTELFAFPEPNEQESSFVASSYFSGLDSGPQPKSEEPFVSADLFQMSSANQFEVFSAPLQEQEQHHIHQQQQEVLPEANREDEAVQHNTAWYQDELARLVILGVVLYLLFCHFSFHK